MISPFAAGAFLPITSDAGSRGGAAGAGGATVDAAGGTTTTGGGVSRSGSGTGASRIGDTAGGTFGASGSVRVGFGVLGAILSGKATESDCRVGVCATP